MRKFWLNVRQEDPFVYMDGYFVDAHEAETVQAELIEVREKLDNMRNNVRQAVHAFEGHSEEAENLKNLVLEQLYP